LIDGLSADALAGRIGALHPGFLPWSQRTTEVRHVLGSGGRVAVTEGGASREEGLLRVDLVELQRALLAVQVLRSGLHCGMRSRCARDEREREQ
jgi:hypothetical protein